MLRRCSEILAVGYLVFRGAIETVIYAVAAMCWLFLVPVAREYVKIGSTNHASARGSGIFLWASMDQVAAITSIIFSLGALMFYEALWKGRVVPRWLSGWGLAGGLLFLIEGIAAVFGGRIGVLDVPLALQEVTLAVWLIVKGFDEDATVLSEQVLPSFADG